MDVQAVKSAAIEDLRAHLAPVPLVALEVAEDLDHDGDPILRLRAVYDDRAGDVTGRQYLDSIGIVQKRLLAMGDSRFGHLTFIALSEMNEAAA